MTIAVESQFTQLRSSVDLRVMWVETFVLFSIGTLSLTVFIHVYVRIADFNPKPHFRSANREVYHQRIPKAERRKKHPPECHTKCAL